MSKIEFYFVDRQGKKHYNWVYEKEWNDFKMNLLENALNVDVVLFVKQRDGSWREVDYYND